MKKKDSLMKRLLSMIMTMLHQWVFLLKIVRI